MAIPIRSIPVLEGEVAKRFERERRKAERERGTIDISEDRESWRRIMAKAQELGTLKRRK
jgi:hypothetical protein